MDRFLRRTIGVNILLLLYEQTYCTRTHVNPKRKTNIVFRIYYARRRRRRRRRLGLIKYSALEITEGNICDVNRNVHTRVHVQHIIYIYIYYNISLTVFVFIIIIIIALPRVTINGYAEDCPFLNSTLYMYHDTPAIPAGVPTVFVSRVSCVRRTHAHAHRSDGIVRYGLLSPNAETCEIITFARLRMIDELRFKTTPGLVGPARLDRSSVCMRIRMPKSISRRHYNDTTVIRRICNWPYCCIVVLSS